MDIKTVNFIKSSTQMDQLPPGDKPEFAFVGRSNVGKSSLINKLCGRKSLAKTSGTPGKTQMINHFIVDDSWLLVDLPGYGYAKVSKKQRKQFEKMLRNYVTQRWNLLTVFVLVDSRHAPQENDLEFISFLGISQIPLCIVFTKLDKLNHVQRRDNLALYHKTLSEIWEELPPIFYTSAETGEGKDEILSYVTETSKVFYQEE